MNVRLIFTPPPPPEGVLFSHAALVITGCGWREVLTV